MHDVDFEVFVWFGNYHIWYCNVNVIIFPTDPVVVIFYILSIYVYTSSVW